MDYRKYKYLVERYCELNEFTPDQNETKDGLIKRLMEISCEKKQIYNDANTIINEYIVKYEKDSDLIDEDTVSMLEDFGGLLMPGDGPNFLDPSISLRICKLLLGYYQAEQNLEQIVRVLRFCSVFDFLLKDHVDIYESSPYSLMAEQYLEDFDKLSDQGKFSLGHCFLTCVYNHKDPTFGLKKYREDREVLEKIYQQAEEHIGIKYCYISFKSIALQFALLACDEAEIVQKNGITPERPLIDIEKEAPTMEELRQDLENALASKDAQHVIADRVTARLRILQTDYYLGKLTVEELLAGIEECSQIHEEYDAHERFSALLVTNVTYLTYLCRCDSFDRQYVLDKSMEIINWVLGNADDASRELKDLTRYIGTYEINRCILEMISAVSNFVEFDFFKSTVLNATVYADRALYVHTMMVKEICLTLVDYILDHNPVYLDGVAGKNWEYCRDHKGEILSLTENCALFHDIGKYFCLDYVSNSSRSLTDDEFNVIKEHPYNFSKVYKGVMSPEIKCIRDCAHLHHRWYNEEGGYPREKHTTNKPLVNILTIADCIDAATDNIGRPYGPGKTLEDLITEFDRDRDIRYSGYISELLHVEEVKSRINYVICDRRKEIYCDIYLRTE